MNNSYFFQSAIEEGTSRNEIIRTGTFTDMHGTTLTITKDHLEQMVKNFSKNALRQTRKGKPQAPVNYGHERGGKAAGWLSDLAIEDKEEYYVLTAETEWVGDGRKSIEAGEYSFISAEILFDFVDSETKKKFGTILRGAGLTNIPAVKGLKALSLQENVNNGETQMNFEDIVAALAEMSMDDKKKLLEMLVSEVEQQKTDTAPPSMGDGNKDVAMSEEVATQLSALLQENEALKAQNAKTTREAQFAEMLASGKVVPAQREAFLSEDWSGFINNSTQINLSGSGHGHIPEIKAAPANKEQAEQRLMELSEEIMTKKGVDFIAAQRLAHEQEPQLSEMIYGKGV